LTEIGWGRHYLMCSPDFFDVAYEINPWMDLGRRPDRERAQSQWHQLVGRLSNAGATIDVLPPVEAHPDMVFTANHGVVVDGTFLPGRFRHAARQGEVPHAIAWLSTRGYEIVSVDPGHPVLEGSGEVLPFGERLVVGHGIRSEAAAARRLRSVFGAPTLSVKLTDTRLYHLDLVFCPLDGEHAIVFPEGLARDSAEALMGSIPRPIVLETNEALSFCANSVVVGSVVLMPACSPRLDRLLSRAGFVAEVVTVNEFKLAGGAIRCLTLPLDIGTDGVDAAAM
jgi:N-dimethylarginine dimethylaminohydrolase